MLTAVMGRLDGGINYNLFFYTRSEQTFAKQLTLNEVGQTDEEVAVDIMTRSKSDLLCDVREEGGYKKGKINVKNSLRQTEKKGKVMAFNLRSATSLITRNY